MLSRYHLLAGAGNVKGQAVAGEAVAGEAVAEEAVAGGTVVGETVGAVVWPTYQSHKNLQKYMVVIILGKKTRDESICITIHPYTKAVAPQKLWVSETKHNLRFRELMYSNCIQNVNMPKGCKHTRVHVYIFYKP